MAIKHLVLEFYCSQTWSVSKAAGAPSFCKNGIGEPGYHCFDNRCTYMASTMPLMKLLLLENTGKFPIRMDG